MKPTTLLIMAAGIGSRFGTGIKQLATVDNQSHIIMDYSIHDAIEAGFNEIIFIIRRDIEEEFKEVIGNRIEEICSGHNVAVKYAFQDINDIPGVKPADRIKPWGTGQAVLAAKDLINNPFAVINADDYYGKEAYRVMHDWLVLEHEPNAYAMAGFILKNTLSDNGGVTRGVCQVADGHTHLTDVVETSNIVKVNGGAEADGETLDPDSFVSMNFWGFPGNPPEFLNVLSSGFVDFFENTVPANPLKAEYLLPTIIGGMLREGECTVKVLPTNDTWYGMTYKEDVAAVQTAFRGLINSGLYKEDLYSDL
ncbi:nucleotidyltransferase [Lactonifactor sp. BIOML-A3]|uniref:sugar phosphate nucleotidyltransferase n=1 Tax=unclassified Lactonifactor TaxID=2636670 RepID=UPI0012AF2355|nr:MULTISPECIES: sugar phosphate nucleotidyltransferase [unclassified Lactonifactor]MSA01736.1 nucleotidyltransferase [Lactonifactor sp. BIOML-A5]MSA08734.1 nucleotidyltransferase [Lactonifactor sp. BIOML-A4]MSA13870.1 nucleotidyltransferase [Lactonifactor sp. BIOML-A3]MSA17111.1 nucleotidyltransferase [Lactonifactor sp. BIOML-A2]MSA37790.1 nucleotidyltransferase [Lactonifactor sp. BIOML-A1]